MNSSDILKNIGKSLRKIREEKNISQKELSFSMGIKPTQYSRIETGNAVPSLNTLLKVAEALEVTTDEIIYGVKKEQEVVIQDQELAQKLELISQLPTEDKFIANQLIDLIITKKTLKELTSTLHKKYPG